MARPAYRCTCVDCGITFVAAHPLAKRCRQCARLHFNAEQLRRYHARRARQRMQLQAPAPNDHVQAAEANDEGNGNSGENQ